MQYHASLITADGAYHCPVGSIMAIFSSVRSSYSHPDLLLIHPTHPLFQITPVLNTGLSLYEPLQLYKGYNAIKRQSLDSSADFMDTLGVRLGITDDNLGTSWALPGDNLGMTWALLWQNLASFWHTMALSGILWYTLAYSGILWYTLAYTGILWHTLAYPGILWHTLAYSGILWHTLALSGILW